MNSTRTLRISLAALGLCGATWAQDETADRPTQVQLQPQSVSAPLAISAASGSVLFTSLAASSTSDVPGFPGVKFAGSTTAFDRPFGNKAGNWLLKTDTDAATTADSFLLKDGSVFLREGDVAPWIGSGETMGPFEVRNGINDVGHVAVKNNTNAATNDDFVARFDGVWTIMAQEAAPIGAFGGVHTYDDTMSGVVLLNDGTVGLEADGIDGGGIATTNDEVYVLEGPSAAVIAQELITIPSGQFTGLTETVEDIDFEDVWFTLDGAHYLLKGNLTGATTSDNVLIYDGAVVLQEGFDVPGLPGDPIASAAIDECAMDLAGNWWARGNLASGQDWVVRNGVVMAKGGDPIFTGSTELYDDATFADLFFLHQGDSLGNFVIGGVTDAVDPFFNGVLVLNNTTLLCREGDPVDVDGNGVFDDGHFINTFGNDDVLLNDQGELFFVVTLRTTNTAATSVAQAVLKIDLNGGNVVTYCTAGTSTNGCVASISGNGTPSAAASSGFTIDVANVEGQKQGLLFYGITGPASATWGGGTSFLCVKAPTQRMPIQTSGGTVGLCDGSFSEDWLAYIASHPFALGTPFSAGDVVYAQAWYRDPPAVKTTNLSNGLQFTLVP